MQAGEANLLKFIKSSEQFIIPIYQRSYSWTLKQCKQLLKDIIRAGENDKINAHFLGSIVYVSQGIYQVTSIKPLLVIDGQQRLTTVMLLFSALRDHMKENNIQMDLDASKINGYYLMNEKEENSNKYKLILTKRDKETFFGITDKKEPQNNDSIRIRENYNFFKEKIAKHEINIFLSGLSKLIVIDISLDSTRDNPQLIFESLNSTGLELTQADLIRNYVLMGLSAEDQEKMYNDYWFNMEKNFGSDQYTILFDRFMRDYLTIKLGKIPNIKEVYTTFKKMAHGTEKINELVAEIYNYSKDFATIALDKEEDKQIKIAFKEINKLKVDVSYPFLLQIYRDFKSEVISKDELLEILCLIESYVFRRAICGIPTNSLNKTFANLYAKIKKDAYVESIKATFILMTSYKRFPHDEEFKDQLTIKDVYNFRSRVYLLRKLENENSKELVNIESFTIEHVMPQKEGLTQEWRDELGVNWKSIQEKYIHTIGNLTLTGYNSELSCKSFSEKKKIKGGFNDSPIRLNKTLSVEERWNEESINKRAKLLTVKALSIWKSPQLNSEILTNYQKENEGVKNQQTYTLEEHPNLTDGPMASLFQKLRQRIINIDSSVKEEIKKLYIAYKTFTNFVDVVPQKSKLRISLNVEFSEINDPKGICRDITDISKWGNGDVDFSISTEEELEYAMNLIQQSFEIVSGEE